MDCKSGDIIPASSDLTGMMDEGRMVFRNLVFSDVLLIGGLGLAWPWCVSSSSEIKKTIL